MTPPRSTPRVAVVGAGISGLAAAYALSEDANVTLFEAEPRFGGHAHTAEVTLDGVTHGVDTGFLVFNHRTYPHLVKLFAELGVETAPAEMSFSVQVRQDGLEWSGSDLAGVFAQKRNLLSPRFLSMLRDVLRFNRLTTALARAGDEAALSLSIGDFLERERFGRPFRELYFMPMIGCIWSCPTDQMLRFPIATMIRFCHNHGLLQVTGRPQWHTVRGGSKHYVAKMLARIPDHRAATPVLRVHRLPAADGRAGVMVHTAQGGERFDDVVLACHSDQALALLSDVTDAERRVLGAIRYQPNTAVLHTDTRVLPRRRAAWASWNYARAADQGREQAAVCLHYLINKLQPLPWTRPVIVSLNPDPACMPADDQVLGRYEYAHPIFDAAAIDAQRALAWIQGQSHVWFCGAWARYGFHEDGLASALDVAALLRARSSLAPVGEAA
jgi:predicted NAD/FAD-binding protein